MTNGAVTWGGTAWNTKLPSLGFVLNSTRFKSGLVLSGPSINSKCCCRICSCFCCIYSRCCLSRLSIMTTEEGLEEELGWREIGFLPPITLYCPYLVKEQPYGVDLMQLLLNVSTDFKYNYAILNLKYKECVFDWKLRSIK